ncbi:MAG: hypothetical protein KGJ48_14330 [Nitrospirota bacterium]|nr:hypothetical protein [Nitrospirota bacterium]
MKHGFTLVHSDLLFGEGGENVSLSSEKQLIDPVPSSHEVRYTHIYFEQRGCHLSRISFEACLSDRYEAYRNGVAASPQRTACPGIQWNKAKAPVFMEPFNGDRLSASGQIARNRRGYRNRDIWFEPLFRPDVFDLKKVRSAMRLKMVLIRPEENRAAAQPASSSEEVPPSPVKPESLDRR